ncbi:MAG TPA: NAD-dependent epimerase/dehydratase family protein [Bryobacteraceae bacterium]|nr:NAD-dependent epimerase/dehydratase family protein [Bryobacteraceae bacterium]
MMITNEAQLDGLLSSPSQADVAAMRALDGDIAILGAGGKMGPTMALRAMEASRKAGVDRNIFAVSRFSDLDVADQLHAAGIQVIGADLLNRDEYSRLPDAPNVLYLAGRKFGSSGAEHLTWAMNAYVPALVCERYADSRVVALSSGNIYPLLPISSGGATEQTKTAPVGEYAQSVLARERIFEYFSDRNGTPVLLVRLNYAAEMRYGVLLDIGLSVFERRPIDLRMGAVNVIWQGDANSACLRAFNLCSSPPRVLNLTGPETVSVRHVSNIFGQHFGVEPIFTGEESNNALLNNASVAHRTFGYPSVTLYQMIEWTAHWIGMGGTTHGKPTKYEVTDGKF